MPRALGPFSLAFALGLAFSSAREARGEELAEPQQPAELQPAEPPPKPAKPELLEKKRELPNYDGRNGPPAEPGEGLLWVPRVLLFPLYVVSEYVVRRPLGWLTVEAERAKIPTLLIDFFTFGEDRNAGLVPTVLIDFGFRPSVGLYFFWNDALAEHNQIRLHASTGGLGWLQLTFTDRVELDKDTRIGVRGMGSRRPDWLFFGIGPRSADDGGRYEAETIEGSLFVDHHGWRSSRFRAFVGMRTTTFEDETCCDDPSVGDLVARGVYAFPPGFMTGYRIAHQGIIAELDTRRLAPRPGSGFRLVLGGEQAGRIDGGEPSEWIRYGAGLGGYWDVTDHNRVLGLELTARFVDPIRSHAEIPFTEQVTFGGIHPLRGFIDQRLVDRSGVSARLEYEWPIWAFLDGTMNAEIGNVFGEHLSGFEPGAMRLSFGFGIRDSGRRDHPFELLIGGGTKPIDEGAGFESFRFVLGATSAF